MGYGPQGLKELDTTERLHFHFSTLWKKSYDKPRQHIKKQRHHFANKGPYIVQVMVFPVVMYKCDSWTIKKAES